MTILLSALTWLVNHVRKNLRVYLYIAAAIVLLLLVMFAYRGCRSTAKLDEAEIQKGEQAVKERNDRELRAILTNSDIKEAVIEGNVANAKVATTNAIAEAKAKYANMNTDDLAAELEKRK